MCFTQTILSKKHIIQSLLKQLILTCEYLIFLYHLLFVNKKPLLSVANFPLKQDT